MTGETKRLIEELVRLRSGGKPGREHFVRAHLVMKGIDPEQHNDFTEDDPSTIAELRSMIADVQRERGKQR